MANKNTDKNTDKKFESETYSRQPNNHWRIIIKNVWHNLNSTGIWASFIVALIFLFITPIFSLFMNNYTYAIIGGAIGLTIIIWMVAIKAISTMPVELPETEIHGYLVPANDPSPQTPCKKTPPPDAATIFVGTNAAWITDTPVVVVRIDDLDLLTLNNTPNGLSVSAKVFSDDGKIIADIENNEFSINPNNYFKSKRPDKHSLEVYDQQANSVLKVRFLNSKNIRVSGVFYTSNQKPIIIDDEKISRPSNIKNNCFGKVPYIVQIKGRENAVGSNKLLQ